MSSNRRCGDSTSSRPPPNIPTSWPSSIWCRSTRRCPACGGTRSPTGSTRSRMSPGSRHCGTICHAPRRRHAGGGRRRAPATRTRSPTPAAICATGDSSPNLPGLLRPISTDRFVFDGGSRRRPHDRRVAGDPARRRRHQQAGCCPSWRTATSPASTASTIRSRWSPEPVRAACSTRPIRPLPSQDPIDADGRMNLFGRPVDETSGVAALRVPPAVPQHGAADRGEHGLVPARRRRAAAGRLAAGRPPSPRRRARRLRRGDPPPRSDRSASACCCCWSSA